MSLIIYLVRHATPDRSRVDLRYDVPPGPPLTAKGQTEAEKLGAFLKTAGVQKIYASPLDRTLNTAKLAADIASVSVVVDQAIAEWRRDENETQVLERCLHFMEAVAAEGWESGPIALVTHGGPIRALLQHLGVETEAINFYRRQFDRDNPAPPAGVWRLARARPESPWQVELVFTPEPHKTFAPEVVCV